MNKCYIFAIIAPFFMLTFLTYGVVKNPERKSFLSSPFTYNTAHPLGWIHSGAPPAVQNPENDSEEISVDSVIPCLFGQWNISYEKQQTLQAWNYLKPLLGIAQVLPNAVKAIDEGELAWNSLQLASVEEKILTYGNGISYRRRKEKRCPRFLYKINATGLDSRGFKLKVPCGLTQGSSITFIGIPNGLLGNFQADLAGETLPGEPDPSILLHYSVRLRGDRKSEHPVIVQNTWTVSHDWGEEERCPSPDPQKNKKVDELDQCNKVVGEDDTRVMAASRKSNGSKKNSMVREGSEMIKYFPFKQGYLSVATLRVGAEGIQMIVDGKHITSFAFRQSLEPWSVGEARISGDIKLISVVASGLPTSDDSEHVIDLKALISPPLALGKPAELFIGVLSTANNFMSRMAVRRTWMQYAAVQSGAVVVRFFVGLHKNQIVNEELWIEALTYRDMQLMPYVDYYSLLTWKTLAICIFGTKEVSAKFVMKTDDDSFVRVDKVLDSLKGINMTRGLLYGLINSESRPHRGADSKWYVSNEEWPDEEYPPWANGPGYVVSSDIAKAVYNGHKNGSLKMFKLEDVAMGIWISEMKKGGLEVRYEMEERIIVSGCEDGYVVAHYQSPRKMLCLWWNLQETKRANCCSK